MKRSHPILRAGALVLATSTTVLGQSPASIPPASAGIVNDWLREQNAAFSAWNLGGQFRPRFEHKEHMAIAGVPGAMDFRQDGPPSGNTYWLFRTKAHVGYAPCDWLGAFAEGRDSFSLNDRRVPDLESDRIDLLQAYLTLGNPKEFPLSLKAGRQELSYGDERLVGAFDWNNLGRVFDAAKVRYESSVLWVDAFVGRQVLPKDGQFNGANDYDFFSGIYASSQSLVPGQETQVYFLARNASVQAASAEPGVLVPLPTARDIYTAGARVKSLPGSLNGWDYSAEAAGQFGRFKESNAGPSLDQSAFAVNAGGGYSFKDCPATPRLGVEYSFSSGDSDPTDDRHETFENLFPTNHKFYGYMDFFSWQNLHNPHLSLSLKPAKGLSVSLDYHLFWLADTADYFYQASGMPRRGGASGAGYDRNLGYGSFVGSEIDLVATYTFKPYAVAQAGYGHFFVGDYVKSSLSGPGFGSTDADWVYVQAMIRF